MPYYSDAERTEAIILLAINKYDFKKTSKELGMTVKTLRNWEKKYPKKGVPELLERAIERMLMHIPSNMRAKDWAIALGILLDKWLLGQGMATSRSENILGFLENMPEDQREEVIEQAERILAKAASRGANTRDKRKK